MQDEQDRIDPKTMTPEQAYEEALRRIDAAAESGQHWLDLGDLPLEAMPPEIVKLSNMLTHLALGVDAFDPEKSDFEYDSGRMEIERRLSDLSPLAGLTGLWALSLHGCDRITDISAVASIGAMRSLNLSGCARLTDLSPIGEMNALQSLDLSECGEVADLSPVSALGALQWLSLAACTEISDISPLVGLITLESLDLRACRSIRDYSSLSALRALRSLSLDHFDQLTGSSLLSEHTMLQSLVLNWCVQLTDLTQIAKLTGLQSLELTICEHLIDLSPLAEIDGLQSLVLYFCPQLTDISALASLRALQSLNLGACRQLSDLSPLMELGKLRSLDLHMCEQVTDLSPLASLERLETLNLHWCKALTDLSGLASLRALLSLNLGSCRQLSDLSPLMELGKLRSLDLHMCEQVTDLSPLASLKKLETLNLSWCKALNDFRPLAELRLLTTLNIYGSRPSTTLSPDHLLTSYPSLQQFSTDQLHATPPELLSEYPGDNGLPRLRDWWQDLQQGEADTHEIKLFILGNGRVGKTQLSRRLRGEGFVHDEPSTHGIQLGRFALSTHDDGRPIFLNVWDFGGQDIYLGTHALFLQSRAIFVLAWHPEHESDAPYTETISGLPMRHRPLRYWLDYMHSLAGRDAPLVVVQTRCEHERDAVVPELVDSDRFDWLKIAVSCASRDDGVDELRGLLKRAARYRLEQQAPPRLPASWLRVRDRLSALRDTHRTIDLQTFEDLCADTQGSAVPSALLHYLHQAGDVFHRKGLFQDAIVLDQQWALDAIYSLFQREGLLSLLHRQRGMFAPALLGFAGWDSRYSANEQALLLSMMESCHLIFPVHRWNDGDALYAMPDALPLRAEVAEQLDALWPAAAVDAKATLHYDFLHDGILRRFLSEIGRLAGPHALYWRHGVCFHDANTRSRACIDATATADVPGTVAIEVCGPSAQELCGHIVKMFEDIRIGEAPQIERDDGASGAASHDPVEDAREPVIAPAPIPLSVAQKPIVYLSYAWGGKTRPELKQFAVELESSLQADFDVRRDERASRSGDRISEFMREIGRGARVLVLLSDPYLRSPNCMRELLHLYHRHLENAHDLQKHVLPLILDADLTSTAKQRLAYVKFWKQRLIELKEETAGLDPVECLPTHHEMATIEEFRLKTEDMLIFLDDILMPRGMPYLSENDFSAVKTALGRPGDTGRH